MLVSIFILLVGFIFLIKGADVFVDGASSIALALKIPTIIIGLTIVAFGTSAPEAAVSISAALENSSAISISNIIGSNIFNILAVLGINAIICTLPITKDVLKRDIPIVILASLLTIVFMLDAKLSRIEGLILLAGIILYVASLVIHSLKHTVVEHEETRKVSMPKAILFVAIGLVGIVLGGDMVVNGAKQIALALGMSEKLVGLTIVSIGTSLPELVTGIIAARKGETDIAIGNVVGSNIFNILFILGISAGIAPYSFDSILMIDAIIMIAVTVLLGALSLWRKKLTKTEGIIFLCLFITYMTYIIIRN